MVSESELARCATMAAMTIPATGLVLRDPLPWHQLEQVVRTAEDTGYQAVFVPEIAGREAFVTLAGLAGATSRLGLGTGVVTIWSRSPVTTAMAAASLQDLSGGRAILGVGAGSPQGPAAWIVDAIGSVEAVRRYVRILRQSLVGETVTDETFGASGVSLALLPEGGPPPLWLGALGDRMISLAGEVADGVLLNWCTPDRVGEARARIRQAAERAGRDPTGLTIAVYVRACLGLDEEVALQALRSITGQYAAIPHYLQQLRAMGLGEAGARAARSFQAGRPQDVPDSLVRALTVTGGRTDALARFASYRQAGADLVLCYPVPALEPFSSILGTVLAAAPDTAVER
jgi:alkanesulfonate monooxygenase SsuD/methylene tetrahydromethanopterin reductase-like flavin-dependent oxidoreductase (luciferase family)